MALPRGSSEAWPAQARAARPECGASARKYALHPGISLIVDMIRRAEQGNLPAGVAVVPGPDQTPEGNAHRDPREGA
jgi:hypothetical protein